jgi:HEAT repeat protein
MITFDLVDTYGSLAYPVEKSIQGYSAIALGKLGEKSAVNDLLGALGDDSKLVQVGVRYALAVLAEPSMIEPFLNEQNPIIKQAAEDILERIKKKCN